MPRRDRLGRHPHRQAAAVAQRDLVLPPVLHPVPGFRDLVAARLVMLVRHRNHRPRCWRKVHHPTPTTYQCRTLPICAPTPYRTNPRYDSLLAKVIVYSPEGPPDALRRARRALSEFAIEGVETNLPILRAIADLRERYGREAAFDYAVGEKLMNFAAAARDHPAFARELPRFVSEVRRLFSADEIRTHLARLEREQAERDAETRDNPDEDEFPDESPAEAAERVMRFATIKDLLTADALGTS